MTYTIDSFPLASPPAGLIPIPPDHLPRLSGMTVPTLTCEHRTRNSERGKNRNPVPADQHQTPTLEKPSRELAGEALTLLLHKLQSKMNMEQAKTSKEEILQNMSMRKKQHLEFIDAVKDYVKEVEKANNLSWWEKALGWIAAVFTFVGAAALTAATGGAAAPLLIAPTIMLVDMALKEAGEKGFGEHFADLFEAMGMSEEAAAIAGAVTYGVILVAASVGAGFATTGVEMAGTAAAILLMTTGALQVAQGGLTIKRGEHEQDACDALADQAATRAIMAKLQALIEEETDRLGEFFSNLNDATKTVMDTLKVINNANDTIIGGMGPFPRMV